MDSKNQKRQLKACHWLDGNNMNTNQRVRKPGRSLRVHTVITAVLQTLAFSKTSYELWKDSSFKFKWKLEPLLTTYNCFKQFKDISSTLSWRIGFEWPYKPQKTSDKSHFRAMNSAGLSEEKVCYTLCISAAGDRKPRERRDQHARGRKKADRSWWILYSSE